MRRTALFSARLLSTATALAQSQSVMIDDLTTTEVQAAIESGKTTAIYYVGGTHQNGEAVALGKHNLLAAHLARRVAEALGNALALPPNPYAPAGDAIEKTGHMRFAGTISLTDETFAAVSRDVIISAIAAGFEHVAVMGEHGGSGQDILENVAAELDSEWRAQGAHVFYVPVYADGEDQMRQHLTALSVPRNRMTPIDDASEIMAIDDDNRWVRRDKLTEDIAKVASPDLGMTFIKNKIAAAVASIRTQIAAER